MSQAIFDGTEITLTKAVLVCFFVVSLEYVSFAEVFPEATTQRNSEK